MRCFQVHATPIVLFMKGNKLFPSCGFSGTIVNVCTRAKRIIVVNVL
jgi:glutaredoxin-related protein